MPKVQSTTEADTLDEVSQDNRVQSDVRRKTQLHEILGNGDKF
jgi:hypothetical protein